MFFINVGFPIKRLLAVAGHRSYETRVLNFKLYFPFEKKRVEYASSNKLEASFVLGVYDPKDVNFVPLISFYNQ